MSNAEDAAMGKRIARRTGLSLPQWRALSLIRGGDYWLYQPTGGARTADHSRRPAPIIDPRTLRVLRDGGLAEIDPTYRPRLRLTAAGQTVYAQGRFAGQDTGRG